MVVIVRSDDAIESPLAIVTTRLQSLHRMYSKSPVLPLEWASVRRGRRGRGDNGSNTGSIRAMIPHSRGREVAGWSGRLPPTPRRHRGPPRLPDPAGGALGQVDGRPLTARDGHPPGLEHGAVRAGAVERPGLRDENPSMVAADRRVHIPLERPGEVVVERRSSEWYRRSAAASAARVNASRTPRDRTLANPAASATACPTAGYAASSAVSGPRPGRAAAAPSRRRCAG